MEMEMNDSEVKQSFRSPPRRRRSTFFEKRDSILPQPLFDDADSSSCIQTIETNDKHNQDLTKYYEKLMAEKDQWKKEVNNRRNIYHDLRQQYQLATKSRSRISYAALTSEDIEFLKAKVNLTRLVDSQSKLHQSVKEAKAYHRRVMQLDDVVLHNCENKLTLVTDYIFENSTIE